MLNQGMMAKTGKTFDLAVRQNRLVAESLSPPNYSVQDRGEFESTKDI
jgi:hypothetical protein